MDGVRGWSRFAGRACGSRGVVGLSLLDCMGVRYEDSC